MTQYERMAAALQATGIPFAEGGWDTAPDAPYGVYAPYDDDALYGDGEISQRVLVGTVDLFTRDRGRERMRQVEGALSASGVWWEFASVLYEPDTRLTHYQWDFEVICDGEEFA